jgi:hypothetical protein
MNQESRSPYPSVSKTIVALYRVSDPDTANRLRRERAGWLDSAEVERVSDDRTMLIMRPGGATRLLP